MCHIVYMPSINMRGLRDTRKLKNWLRAGKTVELRDRDQVIARIVPQSVPKKRKALPDFAAFRREMWGSRVLPGADLVIEERGRY
jgi:antitoxin (DNA-binding transcriptional repressor) of toxin-antitoxin stability system